MAKNTSNQTTEETSDENPTPNTVAILKHSFNVSYPYAPGHPLTELEADALNVLRGQRIAGRVRDTVKELLDAEGNLSAENVAKIQADVDVIDADFTFTVQRASTPIDPIEAEALALAKEYVTNKLKEAGLAIREYRKNNAEKFDANVEIVRVNPAIIALATQRVKDRAQLADLCL